MAEEDPDDIKAVFAKAQQQAQEAPAEPPAEEPEEPEVLPRPGRDPSKPRVRLPDISPRAWEHPTDRAALAGLRKITGFDRVLKAFAGLVSERSLRLLFLANAVRVDKNQFRDLHAILLECCEILDYGEPPELFVSQTPIVNAGCVGIDKPFLVLNSGLLELLDEDELRSVVGHELGHAMSGHALYRTMLAILVQVGMRIGLPIASTVLVGVVMALQEWARKAELSCDRAGLLCCQDVDAAFRVEMKLAGGRRTGDMSVDAFVEQAREYEQSGDVFESLLKLLLLLRRSHPFPVLRLVELKRWVDDGSYDRILAGDYLKRSADADARVYDDLSIGAEAVKARWTRADDPLSKFVQDMGAALGDVGSAVRDMFKRKGDDAVDEGDDQDGDGGGDKGGGDDSPPSGTD